MMLGECYCPKRLGECFCPERVGDFCGPKRLGEFFVPIGWSIYFCPKTLGDFFLSQEVGNYRIFKTANTKYINATNSLNFSEEYITQLVQSKNNKYQKAQESNAQSMYAHKRAKNKCNHE